MSAFRCTFCSKVFVQWLWCRDGRRRLFNLDPVEVGHLTDGQVGWVPGRATVKGRLRVVLAPIGHVSRGKAEAARRVAVLHRCPDFLALYGEVFGTDGGPPDRSGPPDCGVGSGP